MSRFLTFAESLLSRPTAPYCEAWIIEELDRHLAAIPGAEIKVDEFGNRCARVTKGSPTFAPAAFVAHMDHPGFVVKEIEPGGRRIHAAFEGGVNDPFFLGTAVRMFRHATDPGVRGRIVLAGIRKTGPLGNRTMVIETEEDASGAFLGMWDLPGSDVRDGRLYSRSADDIAGVAMILESLMRAAESDAPCDIIGLFTRTEETGFRGALCLSVAEDRYDYLPKDAWVISVETSSARPTTPVGEGAVLRVGDRLSIFDPVVTSALVDVSAELVCRGGHRGLRRALMDGGACEATAFVLKGWRSGGVCVPLGNYHNMNQETGRIDSEYVSLTDCEELIAAMAFLGQGGPTSEPGIAKVARELDEYIVASAPLLKASATKFGARTTE
jgi:putative aminopeptidase FrvX